MFKDLEKKNSDLLSFVLEQTLKLFKDPETGYIARRRKELLAQESAALVTTPNLAASNDLTRSPKATFTRAAMKMPALELPPVAEVSAGLVVASSSESLQSQHDESAAQAANKATKKKKKKKSSSNGSESTDGSVEVVASAASEIKAVTDNPAHDGSTGIQLSPRVAAVSEAKSGGEEEEYRFHHASADNARRASSSDTSASHAQGSVASSSSDNSGSMAATLYFVFSRSKKVVSNTLKGINTETLTKAKLDYAESFVTDMEDFALSRRFTTANFAQTTADLKSMIDAALKHVAQIREPFAANAAQLDALFNICSKAIVWLEEKNMSRLINSAIEYDTKLATERVSSNERLWMKSITDLVKILFALKLDAICMCETNSGQNRLINDSSRDKLWENIIEKLNLLLDEQAVAEPKKIIHLKTSLEAISWAVHEETRRLENATTYLGGAVNLVSGMVWSGGTDLTATFLKDFAQHLSKTLSELQNGPAPLPQNDSTWRFSFNRA